MIIGFFSTWGVQVWEVIEESGSWLLLGLSLAAVLRKVVPPSLVERHLRAPGISSILKASAAGVPLPLCSCSVIPVAVALRRQGAGRGATASFLVSTPEIGVDSFLLSYGLLGWPIAFLRTVAAFVSAVVVGLLVEQTEAPPTPTVETEKVEHCCCNDVENAPSPVPVHGLLDSFLDLLDDISPSLAIGFLLSGLIAAALPLDFFPSLGVSRFVLMLLMLVVSLPTYVCASASTPLAATLIARGLPVGPALVFLLAGPATNMATILVVRSELGRAAVLRYVLGIATVSMLIGALADSVFSGSGIAAVAEEHHAHASPIQAAGAIVFAVLFVFSVARRIRKAVAR